VTLSLFEDSTTYEFFQAVRLLTLAYRDRSPVGGDADPDREVARFLGDVSLAFPFADVPTVEEGKDGGPARMTVAFFGVATPASWGSLPTCYTELILERAKVKDHALRDFLDLFNHRLISLFYRAWEKHQFPVLYERSDPRAGSLAEHVLFAMIGLNTRGLRGRLPIHDLALLPWAGMLSRRPASASQLEDFVREIFDVEASVISFVPAWYVRDDEELAPLGTGRARLGRDTFLGRSVLVAQFRFALRLGPLPIARYRAFLPDGESFRVLRDLVRLAAGPEYDLELRLVARKEDVRGLRLKGPRTPGEHLGWTSWIATRPLSDEPEDVVISARWAWEEWH
jgi:type VI secretion system protein ImpH